MTDKIEHTVYLQGVQRDFLVLWVIFATILSGLTLAGAITIVASIFGLSLSFGFMFLYYLKRAKKMRSQVAGERAKRAEISKEAANARLLAKRSLLDALGLPALIIQEGQIRACNRQAAQLFNLPIGQAQGPVASLRHPGLLAACEEVMVLGGTAECEWQPARTPSDFWHADITALGVDPRMEGMLIVLTDQKPIRQAQQARADFLANASHELRTPLTSISGFIETMKGVAKDDLKAWPRFIDIMDEQTRHMKDLIGDLLSLSRIELSGHLVPDTKLDLGVTVEETLAALQHIGQARGLVLVFEKPARALFIMGDEGELKQVVRNLVGNAMKYAPENTNITLTLGSSNSLEDAQTHAARSWTGAGRVTLRAHEQKEGPAVWFQVRDSGQGVSQEHLPRLGERFFRVDDSRGGPIEGTGLGLAIVKHIVARHRGGFAVESQYGEGAVFSVWFPGVEA